jgi:hypothetical protein
MHEPVGSSAARRSCARSPSRGPVSPSESLPRWPGRVEIGSRFTGDSRSSEERLGSSPPPPDNRGRAALGRLHRAYIYNTSGKRERTRERTGASTQAGIGRRPIHNTRKKTTGERKAELYPAEQHLCIMSISDPLCPLLLCGRARAGKPLLRVPRVGQPQALSEIAFRCTPWRRVWALRS